MNLLNKLENTSQADTAHKRLFWGCFMVLVASAFGFVFRAF